MKKPIKILIIDDDELSIFINQAFIKKTGIDVHFYEARNGLLALNLLENLKNTGDLPDHIILDLNMPIMNGFSFLNKISESYYSFINNIPIYILTSSLNKLDMEEALNYKIHGYFEKPLNENHLNILFRNTLGPGNEIQFQNNS